MNNRKHNRRVTDVFGEIVGQFLVGATLIALVLVGLGIVKMALNFLIWTLR